MASSAMYDEPRKTRIACPQESTGRRPGDLTHDRACLSYWWKWRLLLLLVAVVLLGGCETLRGAINPGRWLGLQRTGKDEKHYLLSDISLNAGSSHISKTTFDHYMNPMINLVFTCRNEKNRYVAESIWYDPDGIEFDKKRTTHDIQAEGKKDIDRRSQTGGTPRVHSISTEDLYKRKPGFWKVELYIDGELARRLEFNVR